MKIAVLGAGAWGTALACSAAERHDVLLWARDMAQAALMQSQRCNAAYLDSVPLPATLQVTADLAAAWAHVAAEANGQAQAGLAIIATPMSGLRACLRALPPAVPVLWLCKGFESDTGALGHEIARAERDPAVGGQAGVLSGPSFAIEVARGQPTALVVASDDAALCELAVAAFHSESLRIYTSADPTGVEVGGAVKNVLAIAAGLLDGLALQTSRRAGAMPLPGLNARAALVTRGLAEMTRLGLALGARAETFMGLSGLGDLVLTTTGALSRNRQVGLLLAQGQTLAQVLASLGHVAEGVYTAATVLRRAHALGVEMPITAAVVEVLQGRWSPMRAAAELMGRGARAEA